MWQAKLITIQDVIGCIGDNIEKKDTQVQGDNLLTCEDFLGLRAVESVAERTIEKMSKIAGKSLFTVSKLVTLAILSLS